MGKKIHIMCPHVIKEPTMLAIWNGIRGWTGSFTWGDGRVADCELLLLKRCIKSVIIEIGRALGIISKIRVMGISYGNNNFWSATNLCLRYASANCGR